MNTLSYKKGKFTQERARSINNKCILYECQDPYSMPGTSAGVKRLYIPKGILYLIKRGSVPPSKILKSHFNWNYLQTIFLLNFGNSLPIFF